MVADQVPMDGRLVQIYESVVLVTFGCFVFAHTWHHRVNDERYHVLRVTAHPCEVHDRIRLLASVTLALYDQHHGGALESLPTTLSETLAMLYDRSPMCDN